MKKYWIVIKNTWNEMLTYRLNFSMWRIRIILSLLMMYFFWFAVIPKNTTLFGYSQSMMITYILGSYFISSIFLSSKTISVGDEINNGNLSNFLLRPINYFYYWFAKDIGDKAMNIVFSVFELFLFFSLFRPDFFIQTNTNYLILSSISILLALFLFFFFNFLLGLIGFWSPEVWGPKFIFFLLLNFFAGILFPLDIIPQPIFNIFQFTPFPYLLYFPVKIYLGQLTTFQIYQGLFISLTWNVLMYWILKFTWQKGLKIYTAQGR